MLSTTDLTKLRARTAREQALLAESIGWLGLMRALIAVLRFKRIARLLGFAPGESGRDLPADQAAGAAAIGWAVGAAAARGPWRVLCLGQALAAAAMLRRRHIAGTLYLGVASGSGAPGPKEAPSLAQGCDPFVAHAWVRCGDRIITGAAGWDRYSVLARFTWT